MNIMQQTRHKYRGNESPFQHILFCDYRWAVNAHWMLSVLYQSCLDASSQNSRDLQENPDVISAMSASPTRQTSRLSMMLASCRHWSGVDA